MRILTRKERDRQLRQSDILKAAERVFASKGYHNATIQDIAKEAQYATGTIYLYFKDKETLYLTLVEKKVQEMISSVKEKINWINNVEDKIRGLIKEHLSYLEENQDFFRIYFSDRDGLRWTIKDKISRNAVNEYIKYIDYISELIRSAQQNNLLRNDVDSKRLAYMLSSLLNAVILPWLKDESSRKESSESLSGFIFDVFFNGTGKNAEKS